MAATFLSLASWPQLKESFGQLQAALDTFGSLALEKGHRNAPAPLSPTIRPSGPLNEFVCVR